jgi:nitrile hydratase accessory protein
VKAAFERPFEAPWQAHAFAITVSLTELGLFTWTEWADAFSRNLARKQYKAYYEHWLDTLEQMVVARAAVPPNSLESWRSAWDLAIERTPHGRPIVPPTQPLD